MMLDLDMAPYAAFVWPAWGVSALVLVGMIVGVLRRWARAKKAVREAGGDEG